MKKLNLLYYSINWSTYTYKPDHYFKLELAKLPDINVRFREGDHVGKQGEYLPDILRQLDFVPDFIYLDDYKMIKDCVGLPRGLNEVEIPKGILFHDVQREKKQFTNYVNENHFDLVFAHYRDAFLSFCPQFRDRFRWLPHHAYKPIFHKYELQRTIDYLMMGKVSDLYPLRMEIFDKMKDMKGFVTHRHPGYKWLSEKEAKSKFVNENYAKEISRAKMFLTCGSKYNFAVSKYFEIPACETLLLASGFPELKDLGFVDKENFVKIDHNNFIKRAQYYLKHEDERNKIRRNGYKLIRSRHTTDIRVREFADELWKYTGKTR